MSNIEQHLKLIEALVEKLWKDPRFVDKRLRWRAAWELLAALQLSYEDPLVEDVVREALKQTILLLEMELYGATSFSA